MKLIKKPSKMQNIVLIKRSHLENSTAGTEIFHMINVYSICSTTYYDNSWCVSFGGNNRL